MCFALYIASTVKIRLTPWDEKDRHVFFANLQEGEERVRSHFTLPEVAYAGSSLGCGCGFRWAALQDGEWPEEGMAEEDDALPEEHAQNRRELHAAAASLLEEAEWVELYGCWDGEEGKETEHEEEIAASRLLEKGFRFRERGLYRIKANRFSPPKETEE